MWDTVVHSPGAHDVAEHLSHDLPACAADTLSTCTWRATRAARARPPRVPGSHAA